MPANLFASTGSVPAGALLVTAMIGGTAASPQPVIVNQLGTGLSQNFVADRSVPPRYFYFTDSAGDLLAFDAVNPSATPAVIASAGALGTTLEFFDIALDNSAIYATTANNKVIKILTAAPYTISVVAGSGTAVTTDGKGAAAAFNQAGGIAIDPLTGAFAYVLDYGNIRKVILATGVVTTTAVHGYGNLGSPQYPIAMGKSGKVYLLFPGAQSYIAMSPVSGAITMAQIVAQNYLAALAVDPAEPFEANFYFFAHLSGTELNRYNLSSATLRQGIATTVNPILTGQPSPYINGCFRNPAYYVVDSEGNLLQIEE